MILSEEMFLVEQTASPFADKLQRLGDLLAAIPTVVLITVRDPREGLPSLHQELFKGLPLREQLSFDCFCRGPRASRYDYTFVIETLTRAGFCDIRGIEFGDLTNGEVSLSGVLGYDALADATLTLGHANSGDKTGLDKRTLPPISLKSIGRSRWLIAILTHSGLCGTDLHRSASRMCGRILLRSGSARRLRLPEDALKQFMTSLDVARQILRLS